MQFVIMRAMVNQRRREVLPSVKMRRYWRAMESLELVREKLYMKIPTKKRWNRLVMLGSCWRKGRGWRTLRNSAALSGSVARAVMW